MTRLDPTPSGAAPPRPPPRPLPGPSGTIALATAARILGIAPGHAARLAERGEFPCRVINAHGEHRVPFTALLQVLEPGWTGKLLYTVEEAAALLGFGRTFTFYLVASGEIESIKIGKLREIPHDALVSYISHLRSEQAGPPQDPGRPRGA
jgi:excisionase family DNA binding protein